MEQSNKIDINYLPAEILQYIFLLLPYADLLKQALVCKSFLENVKMIENNYYERHYEIKFPEIYAKLKKIIPSYEKLPMTVEFWRKLVEVPAPTLIKPLRVAEQKNILTGFFNALSEAMPPNLAELKSTYHGESLWQDLAEIVCNGSFVIIEFYDNIAYHHPFLLNDLFADFAQDSPDVTEEIWVKMAIIHRQPLVVVQCIQHESLAPIKEYSLQAISRLAVQYHHQDLVYVTIKAGADLRDFPLHQLCSKNDEQLNIVAMLMTQRDGLYPDIKWNETYDAFFTIASNNFQLAALTVYAGFARSFFEPNHKNHPLDTLINKDRILGLTLIDYMLHRQDKNGNTLLHVAILSQCAWLESLLSLMTTHRVGFDFHLMNNDKRSVDDLLNDPVLNPNKKMNINSNCHKQRWPSSYLLPKTRSNMPQSKVLRKGALKADRSRGNAWIVAIEESFGKTDQLKALLARGPGPLETIPHSSLTVYAYALLRAEYYKNPAFFLAEAIIKKYPQESAWFTAVDKNGNTLAHLAATNFSGRLDFLHHLSQPYLKAIINMQNNAGQTPQHLLNFGGMKFENEIVFIHECIQAGLNFRLRDQQGNSLWHLFCINSYQPGWPALCIELFMRDPQLLLYQDSKGFTPLHDIFFGTVFYGESENKKLISIVAVCFKENPDLLAQLSSINFDLQDQYGQTLLHHLDIMCTNLTQYPSLNEFVQLLISAKIKFNSDVQDKYKRKAFVHLYLLGDKEKMPIYQQMQNYIQQELVKKTVSAEITSSVPQITSADTMNSSAIKNITPPSAMIQPITRMISSLQVRTQVNENIMAHAIVQYDEVAVEEVTLPSSTAILPIPIHHTHFPWAQLALAAGCILVGAVIAAMAGAILGYLFSLTLSLAVMNSSVVLFALIAAKCTFAGAVVLHGTAGIVGVGGVMIGFGFIGSSIAKTMDIISHEEPLPLRPSS